MDIPTWATATPLRFTLAVAFGLPVAMNLCGSGAAPMSFQLKEAVIRRVDSVGGSVVLTLSYGDRLTGVDERVALTPPEIPVPYRNIVPGAWSRPCSGIAGSKVLISHLESAASTVLEEVALSARTSTESPEWRPCFVRRYFDLTSHGSPDAQESPHAARSALAIALRALADQKEPIPVWMSGTADEVLAPYARAETMIDAAARHGQPGLASSVRTVGDIRTRLNARRILAKVVPFKYQAPEEVPVGGHGYFAVAIYEERGTERPVLVVDRSTDIR
jgi:hypothetical protein